jgi:hypothetical protein
MTFKLRSPSVTKYKLVREIYSHHLQAEYWGTVFYLNNVSFYKILRVWYRSPEGRKRNGICRVTKFNLTKQKLRCVRFGSHSGADEDSSRLGPCSLSEGKWFPQSSGMWHRVNYKHCSQTLGAGLRSYVCERTNWTAVGKAISEKGSGIPGREFVTTETDLKLSPRDTICELLLPRYMEHTDVCSQHNINKVWLCVIVYFVST